MTYLEHLSDHDLRVVAQAAGSATDAAALRAQPAELERALADPHVFAAVFGPVEEADDPLAVVSPFLVFAVAVNRAAVELERLTYVEEWAGPRQRIPVFAAAELRAFVDDATRRLFLVELLTSYTRVRSGAVWVRTPRGRHRRAWSDLDPVRLASLLEVLPGSAHAGLYRRLGDVALFLSGVFPDHVAGRMFRPLDLQRLSRALSAGDGSSARRLEEALALRGGVGLLEELGARWYRQALELGGTPARGTPAHGTLASVAEHFTDARRVLNLLTDRYLFPFRARWFPPGEGSSN